MKFSLTTPCKNCPFLRGSAFVPEEVPRVLLALEDPEYTTTCHRSKNKGPNEEHCAGARLALQRLGRSNHALDQAGVPPLTAVIPLRDFIAIAREE